MDDIIVRSIGAITLVGGGSAERDDLEAALRIGSTLVAADGGADFALESGHAPSAVIGDMDSLSQASRRRIPKERQHAIVDQDRTDFDKTLGAVAAPLVLGVGFLGRRVDHQLANLNVLVRRHRQPCILIGRHDVIFVAPERIALDLPPGSRVSLFPMAPVRGRSHGLHWPIEGLDLSPDGAIGTSNRVAEDHRGPVEIAVASPGLLIILPRASLDTVAAALLPRR